MIADPQFPPLDKSTLMLAMLTPVLDQWVADTVAFQQAVLTLDGLQEPGRRELPVDDCRRLAQECRDFVLRSAKAGNTNISVPLDDLAFGATGAPRAFPLESLQRLSELQREGLLPGVRLVWPRALAHLDTWGTESLQPGGTAPGHLGDPFQLDSDSSEFDVDDDGDQPTTAPAKPRRRRPGDKCAIS